LYIEIVRIEIVENGFIEYPKKNTDLRNNREGYTVIEDTEHYT